MEFPYAQNLKTGDLIVISNYNYLTIGILVRLGKNSVSYYPCSKTLLEYLKTGKSYINRGVGRYITQRVAKINLEVLDEETQKIYKEIKNLINL